MKEKIEKILVLILIALVIVGCGTDSEETTADDKSESEESSTNVGGELRAAMSDQPLTLDRHLTTALSTEHTSRLINETLLTKLPSGSDVS